MSPARVVFLLVGGTGVLLSLFSIAGLDLALVFGFLDPGVGLHTTDVAGRLGFGIAGGLMAGWAITCDGWLHGRPAATTIRQGAVAWFVLDSAASLACGMWPNALFNVVFLVAMLGATVAAARPAPATR